MRILYTALVALVPAVAIATPPPGTTCPVFPADNVWNTDISTLPVHPRSAAWLASMASSTTRLHPDFGGSYGIPFAVVDSTHPKVSVEFGYADESDPGPYPFGPDIPIEGGSDAHALMIDKNTCTLYELYVADWNGGSPTAGSGAIFSLTSNDLRPDGWTSGDAAGLPIFPGLVRYDEVQAGAINHALRVTAARSDKSYLWPARHQAGAAYDSTLPPMGARFRLKSSFSLSGYSAQAQVILRALQHYGFIVADNGQNWFFQGAVDSRWPDSLIAELKTVPGSAFEAVDESSLQIDPDSGQAIQPGTSGGGTGGGGTGGTAVATAAVSPTSLSFPRLKIGRVSGSQVVTVSSTGTASLSVSQVSLGGTNPGDFRIASNGCATVAPGASCAISIRFAPTASGTRTATLVVSDNAATSPQRVTLSGRGR